MTSESRLNACLDELAEAGRLPGLHGLVVMRHGRLAAERYGSGADFRWGEPLGQVVFGPEVLHDLRSVTKSLVALVYGAALADGQVPGPAEPLLRQFPEYPDLAADPARAGLTVEHALTMTMGLQWREDLPYTSPDNSEIAMESAPDRYRYVLERPVTGKPGERWAYCGGATALVGRLIVKGTGLPLPEYTRRVLFEPLGIASSGWNAGQDGVASPASGLRLTPRDLARIGQLALDHGRWAGRQVIPEAGVAAALGWHVPVEDDFGYGYQWWLGTLPAPGGSGTVPWVGGNGNGGQRLYLLPSLDLVVAITCGNYDGENQSATPVTLMTEAILPAIASDDL